MSFASATTDINEESTVVDNRHDRPRLCHFRAAAGGYLRHLWRARRTQSSDHRSGRRCHGDHLSRLDPAKLHALAADSWEGQIPAAAEKGGAEALRLNLSDAKLSGAYTLDSEEGDTLAACWTRGDGSGHKLWLWDTPSEVSFLAEVSPALIGDNNRLVEYSEGSSTGTTLPGSR